MNFLSNELVVAPSDRRRAWQAALLGADDAMLTQLIESELPGVALYELMTFINGLYHATQLPLVGIPIDTARQKISRVLPVIRLLRRRLGVRQREFDIQLMRMIRRSSALSAVVGAGVTMSAGGPSWPQLVRLLLNRALTKGHEIAVMAPTSGKPLFEATADGGLRLTGEGTYSVERRVVRVERLKPDDESEARRILDLIEAGSANTEDLMQGAQICSNLYGQELFTHITGIIYARAKRPSALHYAIAELAESQDLGNRLRPGWDSIITYNFDSLLSEALTEHRIPCVALVLTEEGVGGDGDHELIEQAGWCQQIFHLHGYTPRRLFVITDTLFVFSTAQYLDMYRDERRVLIDDVLDGYLANPVHLALYIGCSFSDGAMNNLLREAAERYPGRLHYALLKWPGETTYAQATSEQLDEQAKRYLEIGVQPVWVDDYAEIPVILRHLK